MHSYVKLNFKAGLFFLTFFKVPVFKCQKMTLRAPKPKNRLQKPRKTPPKWWGRHLLHAFPLSSEYQANFEKMHIFYRFGPILEGKKAEN